MEKNYLTYNDYWIHEDCFIFKPDFNEPIDNYIEIIKNYNKLIFSNHKHLASTTIINDKIKYFTPGSKFNQPLTNSLDKLTNLTHLTLGYEFTHELYLSPNIKILTLDCNNQNLIDNLSNSIEQLNFNQNFNLLLDNLPNSIKKISLYILNIINHYIIY